MTYENEAAHKLAANSTRGPGDCLTWTRRRTKGGYGRVTIGGVDQYAHRAAFTLRFGEIPPGLQIDHLCRNRACVNPDHLEAVTQAENIRRGTSPAAICGRRATCSAGHDFDYVRRDGSRGCHQCENRRQNARRGAAKARGA